MSSDSPWLDHLLEVDGGSLHLSGVSMGNPHAVTFDEVGGPEYGARESAVDEIRDLAHLDVEPLVAAHADDPLGSLR